MVTLAVLVWPARYSAMVKTLNFLMLDLEFAFTVVSAMAETLMLDLEFAISHGKNFHVGLGLLSTM